jgi:peptidoglycan/xylan/chitin deacetylase (PgdA/CDA1 family)
MAYVTSKIGSMKALFFPLIMGLALSGFAKAKTKPAKLEPFDIAITVDDLPVHATLPLGQTRKSIAQSYVATLKAHGVAEAYGFVNAVGMEREADADAGLEVWRQAGFPLGNHSFTHMNLNTATSLQAWETDVLADEAPLAERMSGADWAGADWKVFRYPNLAAGTPAGRHDAALSFLKMHGYAIAEVSISFDDWAYSDAYARCSLKGDQGAIKAMKAQYLEGVNTNIAHMKALSKALYGRIIPQVLLTHIGGFGAEMLPETLKRLEAAGAHYVPLKQALADPAYLAADPQAGENVMLDRVAKARGLTMPGVPEAAHVANLDGLCR